MKALVWQRNISQLEGLIPAISLPLKSPFPFKV
jgi:hypothetical protein